MAPYEGPWESEGVQNGLEDLIKDPVEGSVLFLLVLKQIYNAYFSFFFLEI